ncbi:MAG: T9SS type A sorting domain-containing protein [Hymenobacter sp.]|nr:MAG: T9SS type A sorting domain-containing protein [Hymenobacter sp.]
MKKYLLLIFATASLSSHAQGTLNSGLLGRFPFDNSLVDATGNIGNASSANVAYGPDSHGQANTALRLTGTGEVAIEPNGLLDFGTTGSFTFSVAFRTLSSGTQTFFNNKGNYSANTSSTLSQGWSFGFDNTQVGRLYLDLVRDNFYNGSLAIATQATFNDGLWHTVALVVNRSTRQMQMVVDGTAQPLIFISTNPNYGAVSGTTFTLTSAYSQIVDLTPGYSYSYAGVMKINNRFGMSYNGWLDEARFYNRALTVAEVQTLSAQVLATLTAQEAAAQVQVAPNPVGAAAAFTVTLAQPVAASQLQVLDLLGRPVPVAIVVRQAGSRTYELSGLATGLYLLHVTLPQGVAVQRVQVN